MLGPKLAAVGNHEEQRVWIGVVLAVCASVEQEQWSSVWS